MNSIISNITTTSEIFGRLREDEENRYCFDCTDIDITHASVNLGILLCEKCAHRHHLLGINISCIKSWKDSWTTRHLKLMTAGGNASLKAFFSMYSIAENSPNEYKYRTIACEYYREMLKMMAEGETIMMVTPSLEEGVELMEEYRTIKTPFKRAESTRYNTDNLEYKKTFEAIKENNTFLSIKGFTTDALEFMGKGIVWGAEKSKEGLEWGANEGLKLIRQIPFKEKVVEEAQKVYQKIQANLKNNPRKLEALRMLEAIEKRELEEEKNIIN